MKVLVVPDGRYYKLPNGKIYAESIYTYDFFKRYLTIFDEVLVAVRIVKLNELKSDMKEISGKGIKFIEIPNYQGPWQHVWHYSQLLKAAKLGIRESDCAIFRVPAATANTFQKYYEKSGKCYAIEVVVDPEEYFGKRTMKSILRFLIQKIWTKELKKMCLHANGVSYVTNEYLQKKYPCQAIVNGETKEYFTSSYSSVMLSPKIFSEPRKYFSKEKWIFVHCANYISGYRKGHLTVLNTVKELKRRGKKVEIRFIGDGKLVKEFQKIAQDMGINKEVVFVGRLSNQEDVIKEFRNADIMIFPTMAEGLPRVLLEAMATGLPCVSSPVCGIPEILDEEFLIDYDNYMEYADKVEKLMEDIVKLNQMSADNIKKAWEYEESILNTKRKEFYCKLFNSSKCGE